MAGIALLRGATGTFFEHIVPALELHLRCDNRPEVAHALSAVATYLSTRPHAPRGVDSVRLFAAAEATFTRLESVPPRLTADRATRMLPGLRAALGDAGFAEAWSEGERLDLESAVQLAVSLLSEPVGNN